MELGKIEKLDLRKVWKSEPYEFTKWLAESKNLELLSKEIGINIKLRQTEAGTGDFSTDILAEEENTGRKIIIENQLEITDHKHLGQIITYASGHDAEIIIWIVGEVREEHQQAVDWLNEHTDGKINLFLIQIELWKIGESNPAPKFQIVSQPNDWANTIKSAARGGSLSELALQQLEFLKGFIKYCEERKSSLRLGRPQPTTPAYYTVTIGSSDAWVAVKLNTNKKVLKVDLYFKDKEIFSKLEEQYKEQIEKELDYGLLWDKMDGFKGAIVGTGLERFNIDNQEEWPDYFNWLKDKAEKFQEVFRKYISKIKESKI